MSEDKKNYMSNATGVSVGGRLLVMWEGRMDYYIREIIEWRSKWSREQKNK